MGEGSTRIRRKRSKNLLSNIVSLLKIIDRRYCIVLTAINMIPEWKMPSFWIKHRDSVKREDMSMSGFAEISRVFFLARRFSINRRKRDRICFWLKIR